MGGNQGGKGKFGEFGYYDPHSLSDHIVESYAGPHDYLNRKFFYDGFGNIKQDPTLFIKTFARFIETYALSASAQYSAIK